MPRRPNAVIFAGPSGVGKGTLIGKLRLEFPSLFGFSVSHTTRSPRPGERDGVEYHFTSVDAMKAQIAEGKFIEYAEVHGRYYGTSIAAVEAVRNAGKICILDIDVQGCRLVRKANFPAKFMFISPPSMQELEQRLRGRGTEDEAAVAKRLENARGEMEARDEPGLFDCLIINDDLERAYSDVKNVLADELAVARSSIAQP